MFLRLFQGVSVPLQAKNSNPRWVSSLVLWRRGPRFHSKPRWGVVVTAEGPQCGSECPDATFTCHNPSVAPRRQRGHATATAASHQPYTLTVIQTQTHTHSQACTSNTELESTEHRLTDFFCTSGKRGIIGLDTMWLLDNTQYTV